MVVIHTQQGPPGLHPRFPPLAAAKMEMFTVLPLEYRCNEAAVELCRWLAEGAGAGAELLQLTVVISRPPIRVFVYDSWAMPDAQATPSIPYLFDRECLPTDRRLSDPAGPSRSGGGEL